jgi:hypothetical protein
MGRPLGVEQNQAAPMIPADLQAADILYRDESGKVFDFHSLRTSFATNLIKSGVSVKQAQALVRHSTPTLTLGTYSALTSTDLASGLAKLPGLGAPTTSAPEAMKATGTGENFAPLFAPDQGNLVPFGSSSFPKLAGQTDMPMSPETMIISGENTGNPVNQAEEMKCPRWDSNPHASFPASDFKSDMSANSITRAALQALGLRRFLIA